MKKISLTLAVFIVVALSACGSATSSNTGPGASSTGSSMGGGNSVSDTDKSSILKDYFDAYASADPDSMRSAAENAANGSVAQKYITHQSNIAEAYDASGYDRYVQDAKYSDESVSICGEDDDCGEFADLSYENSKLSSFTVDGNDISDRISLGDGSIVKSKEVAGFEVLSSYQAVEGSLMAVVRFHAYDRPINFSYTATYRKPSGQQIEDVDSYLPSRVAADSNQLAIVIFPNSNNGGNLHLKFATDDDEEGGELIVETVDVPLAQN